MVKLNPIWRCCTKSWVSNLKTGIKDDDVLESLLGDMKSTSKAKPGSAGKRKATSPPEKVVKTPGGGGSGGAGGPSSINPFAKPKSTGIKRPKIKREVEDGDDSSALDLLEYDDATASEAIEDVGDDEVKAAEMTATQNIEDFDEAELSNAMEEDFAEEEKEEKKPDVACNRGFAVKSEEGAAKARVLLSTLKFDFISMQNSGQIYSLPL